MFQGLTIVKECQTRVFFITSTRGASNRSYISGSMEVPYRLLPVLADSDILSKNSSVYKIFFIVHNNNNNINNNDNVDDYNNDDVLCFSDH